MKKTTLMRTKELERNRTLEEIIAELAATGATDADIAQELGISCVTYYDWIRRLGAAFSRTRSVQFGTERQSVAS